MKILLIHNFYRYPGGEESYLDMVSKLLKSHRHKVKIYHKKSGSIRSMDYFQKMLLVIRMFWNPEVFNEVDHTIKDFRPDIVQINNIFPLITPSVYWACRKNGVPIIQVVHSLRFMFPFTFPMSLGQKLIYGSSIVWHKFIGSFGLVDKYIFVSKFTRDYYLARSAIKKEKSLVVPHFIENYRNPIKNRNNYFLFAGRISYEKGIYDLLEVFTTIPKANLIIVGNGPLLENVKKYNYYPNINIIGRVSRSVVLDYMSLAKIVVVPSRVEEAFPLTVLEAYSRGTPVLVPKVGVFKTLVKEGSTGSFFKFKDTRDLASKIKMLSKKKIPNKNYTATYREGLKYSSSIFYERIFTLYELLRKSRINKRRTFD